MFVHALFAGVAHAFVLLRKCARLAAGHELPARETEALDAYAKQEIVDMVNERCARNGDDARYPSIPTRGHR